MADTTFYPKGYLSRSWKMLTQDAGWWKIVLLLALAFLVPIVGWLGVIGYIYEWARLTAWGVDSAPKQKGVRVGECIGAGWRVFVVMLGLGILLGIGQTIVTGILGAIFGYGILGWLVTVVGWAILAAGALFISVATLRAEIYQKIGPGYGLGHVWKMCSHDPKGLLRVLGIEVLGYVVEFAVALVLSMVFVAWGLRQILPMLFSYGYYLDEYMLWYMLESVFSGIGPIIVVILYVCNLVVVVFTMLSTNAVALWIRQFDVPNWGDSHEELPEPITAGPDPTTSTAAAAPQSPVAPTAAPVVPVAPVVKPATQEEGTVEYPNQDVNAGKVSDLHPTAPTQQDLYETAPDTITEWTSVVEPENPVTHVAAKPVKTEKPVEQGTDGFPSEEDVYEVAGRKVTERPDVDLEATNAISEQEVAEKMADAKPQVFDDPITVPTEKDIYEAAAKETTDWTSVVEPENAVDHMPWKPKETEKPVEQGTDGFPSEEDVYEVAGRKVTEWPDVDLEATNAIREAEEKGESDPE